MNAALPNGRASDTMQKPRAANNAGPSSKLFETIWRTRRAV